MHSPAASFPPPPFLPPTFPPSLTVTSQAQVSLFPALTFSLFSLKMSLSSLCIWLLLFCRTLVDSGEVNLLDYSGFGPCDITLTPEEPCEQEGDNINCPYLFNVPPLTVHLPKQLRELERIVDELQMLKDNVDELRRMCADCTVRQTGRECDRESETVNEGKNRKKDQGNWLNAGSLKDHSLEHGTTRVKSGNRSDGYSEREVEETILEEENKGGSVGQNTTGEINEEVRGARKQGVSITGTVHIQRAKEQNKWTAKAGGNGKFVDLVNKSTDEISRWGKTDERGNYMNRKENSRGDREYMLENGEESIVLGDLKSLEKPHPHLGQDRTKEIEKKTHTKEIGSSKVKNMPNFHNKDTDKRQQQDVEEQKKEIEKGTIVEQGNEKLRGASIKGEEGKKETGQESKTKGEKRIQRTQTDGDSGLASSKDTAEKNYASKGQTPSISAESPRQESADSNAALSYHSSHGYPAFSCLTPPLTSVHKGLTTTAAGPQMQTTDLSATFIAEPGFTAPGKPTTAPVNTGQQGFTGPHRVVRPTTATTTTTKGPTIATLPGISQHHHSPAKMNVSSNTKTGVKPLGTNSKIKTAKVNNSPKPAQGLFSDKKTKYDQKQKPPYHKPLTKPRFKGSQLFQGLKPSQRTGISPADLNLKITQPQKIVNVNPTNQNQSNIQTPKSPPKLPVQRPMSQRRHLPFKMNNHEKHLPIEQKPKSTQITNVTQNEKISNLEKKTIHLLKMDGALKKSAIEEKQKRTPEINHGLRDIEGQTENKQKTNFTPQLFHEADAELLENADGRPLSETKNLFSGQKVTPSPIPIKLFNQSQTTNLSLNLNFEPGKMSKINHQGPEPQLRPGSNVSAELQQTDTEEGQGTPQQNQTPRFSSTPVSERNPGAESSNTPLSKQRSHTRPIDTPQVERSKPSLPIKPISKTDPDLDPLQMARTTLDPFQFSQTSTPPSPGSAKSFAVVDIDPGETEVSSIEAETQYSKTISSLEGGAKLHLNTLPEDFMLSPVSRKISDQKSQTSAPTPLIQAATTSRRVTPGLLPSGFHESVLLYSKPKNNGESKHDWEDKQAQLSKPDNGPFSDALPTDQRTQIPEHTLEPLFIQNTKQKTTPPILRPTGGLTDLLPEADKISRTEKSSPGLTSAGIHRGETNHKPDGWSVSTATQPENIPRLPPKLLHVMTPLTGIMENSVNSESGSKPVLPDPNLDSRNKFAQIKPKPAPAPKTGLNQSDPDFTTDPEAEYNLEPDKTSHIDRGLKPPLPDLTPIPTPKPVSDGTPGAEYDGIPSPLPRHRSPSTPTAEPGATSAQRSTQSFPLKSGSKPKTSGHVQNSQIILPPSSGPVKLLDDVTNSWGDTEVSTIKMTTLDLKSSISQDGRAIPHLHTLPRDFMANPNSRIRSHQKSQTTAAPPSIQVTDRPNRIIPWVLSSVPPSDSPTQQKQAANVDSKLHHNQEETTKSQIYDSNKVMNTIPSSSSADLRSTNPANSGPQPLAPDVSTESTRELRVKINQVAAFFNNNSSTSGKHPERHSADHPEDKQRGSRPDGINSKLLTRTPSKGKTGS